MSKICRVCGIILTPETRYKGTTNLLCKTHDKERRYKYPYWDIINPNEKVKQKENYQRMYQKYPEKYKARQKLLYAVKTGKIIKSTTCSIFSLECKGQLQAHHYLGYDEEHWKDVKWLCRKHHSAEHYPIKKTIQLGRKPKKRVETLIP